MIKYDRLWQTMKQRGVSQYDLYTHYNVNRSQLFRLSKKYNIRIVTGVNLSMVMYCVLERSDGMTADELIEALLQTGRAEIVEFGRN